VGKPVIREVFTPLERSLRPKGRSFEKIQCGRGLNPLPNFLTGFTEFHDPCPCENGERNPPLTPPKRGIVESPPKRGIIRAIIKLVLV